MYLKHDMWEIFGSDFTIFSNKLGIKGINIFFSLCQSDYSVRREKCFNNIEKERHRFQENNFIQKRKTKDSTFSVLARLFFKT